MNRKTLSFALILMFLVSYQIFAKRDITKREVEKMDSWKEEFDLSSKKTGKYNVIVTDCFFYIRVGYTESLHL